MEAEGTEGGAGKISFRAERQSRDLLMRFSGSGSVDGRTEAAGGDSDEIDLSLCLSLGGSLGVDSGENKLVRSSSMIASLTMLPGEEGFAVAAPLVRTCSLPTEAEENRKRREMQSLKRLEAKRKRSEKRNLWPVAAAVERPEERSEEHVEGRRVRTAKVGKIEVELRGCPRFGEAVGGVAGAAAGSSAPISQGSVGSQGSSVSGAPNFEARPMQGFDVSGSSSCTPAKNPSTVPSLPEHNRATAAPRTASVGRAALRKVERNVMEEMPCVSTKGEGPNGRRIEGFLYKYRKGEEVRIVCVCHGSFLSPAEFIRHAGGGDVAHPLKHIVVNPSPSTF